MKRIETLLLTAVFAMMAGYTSAQTDTVIAYDQFNDGDIAQTNTDGELDMEWTKIKGWSSISASGTDDGTPGLNSGHVLNNAQDHNHASQIAWGVFDDGPGVQLQQGESIILNMDFRWERTTQEIIDSGDVDAGYESVPKMVFGFGHDDGTADYADDDAYYVRFDQAGTLFEIRKDYGTEHYGMSGWDVDKELPVSNLVGTLSDLGKTSHSFTFEIFRNSDGRVDFSASLDGQLMATGYDEVGLEQDGTWPKDGSDRVPTAFIHSEFNAVGTASSKRCESHFTDNVKVTHRAYEAGDVNRDGAFTAAGDAAPAISNLGVAGDMYWTSGDMNGDGTVTAAGDVATIISKLGTDTVTTGTAAATYDPTTGELTVSANAVAVIAITSASGSFLSDAESNISDFTDGLGDLGLGQVDLTLLPDQTELSWVATSNVIGTIENPLDADTDAEEMVSGIVLATGLTGDDLTLTYTVAGSGQVIETGVTIIPEPASVMLLGLGGLALAMRRRND